jgi:hypothetical protein
VTEEYAHALADSQSYHYSFHMDIDSYGYNNQKDSADSLAAKKI